MSVGKVNSFSWRTYISEDRKREIWYDRHHRTWVMRDIAPDGVQLGECSYDTDRKVAFRFLDGLPQSKWKEIATGIQQLKRDRDALLEIFEDLFQFWDNRSSVQPDAFVVSDARAVIKAVKKHRNA